MSLPDIPPEVKRVYAYGSSKSGSLEKRARCGMGNTVPVARRSVIIEVNYSGLRYIPIEALERRNGASGYRRDLRALGKRV